MRRRVVQGSLALALALLPAALRAQDVPLTLVDEYRAAVPVMINGHGPYLFAVETGAPIVLITERTATAAGLGEPTPGRMTALRPDSFRIGDHTFAGITLFSGPEFIAGIDGLLGLPAYAELLLTVDYPGRRASFTHDSLPAADGINVLETLPIGPFFGVMIEVGGRRYPAVIDTQGGTSISAPPELVDSLPFESTPVLTGQARIGGRPAVPVTAGRLRENLRLGRYTFERPIIHVMSPPPGFPRGFLIGAEVLSEFRFSLDESHQRARFERGAAALPAPPPLRTYGFALTSVSDSVTTIGLLRPGSPAERAGLRTGDVVLRIDGTPARTFLASRILGQRAQRGEAITMDLLRAGGPLSVRLEPDVAVP